MSNSKYIRLQELVFDRFNLDAPVEIEKGALLLESTNKTVLLQLRLNVLENVDEISSISLNIYGFTDSGEEVEGSSPFNYTYSDIYLQGNKSFGDRTPIILDSKIRKVTVVIEKVVYRNGDVWRSAGDYVQRPVQKSITTIDADLLPQFQREISGLSETDKQQFLFIPLQFDDYWICACGGANRNVFSKCRKCGLQSQLVFKVTNTESLQKNLDKCIDDTRIASDMANQQAIEKARVEEENHARLLAEEKVRTKRLNTGLFITGIIGLLIALFFYVTLPALKYSQASDYLANKEYNFAIYVFDSLGNYRNSEEMVYEANYQKATDFLTDKKLDDAIKTFSYIKTYRDSDTKINEANYQKAKAFFQEGNYPEAILLFSKLGNFGDSNSLLRDSQWLLAEEYLADNNYQKAVEILETLANYENAAEVLLDTKYLLALEYYKLGEFAAAKAIFQEFSNYKDSNSYLKKLDILNGIQGKWVQDELGNTFQGLKIVRFEGWKYFYSTAANIDEFREKDFSESSLTDYGLYIFLGITDDDFGFEYNYTNQTLVLHLAIPIDYKR